MIRGIEDLEKQGKRKESCTEISTAKGMQKACLLEEKAWKRHSKRVPKGSQKGTRKMEEKGHVFGGILEARPSADSGGAAECADPI